MNRHREGEVGYYNERNTLLLNRPRMINNWVPRNNHEEAWNRKRSEFGSSWMGNEEVNFRMPIADFTGSLKPRPMLDRWVGETNEPVVFSGQGRGLEQRKRFPTPYADEGPSNYQRGYFDGYAEQKRIHHNYDGPSRVGILENERVDRWDGETNEQMVFSGQGRGLERQKRFPIPYADEGPSNYQRGYSHGYAEQKRIHHDYDGPSRVGILENERVDLIRKLDELKDQIIRCGDLSEKPRERLIRTPPVLPNNYYGDDSYVQVSPTRLYSVSMQPFAPDKYLPEKQPVRHTNGRGFDAQDLSSPRREISNEIVVYDSSNRPQWPSRHPHHPPPQYLMPPYHDPFSQQHETFPTHIACSCLQCYNTNMKFPSQVPPTLCDSKDSNTTIENFVVQSPKTVSSMENDFAMGAFAHRDPTRVVVAAHGSERACHPVLGGAPFLACCSCFELLKLPRKLVVMGKNQQKIRCGACSAILKVDFEKKRVIVTISQVPKQVLAKGDDAYGEKLSENLQSSQNHSMADSMDLWSDEFERSGCKFPATDTDVAKRNILSSDQSLNFSDTIERKDPLSSASSFTEDQHSHVVSRYEDQEKVILNRSTSEQNHVEDVSVATEFPSHGLLNSSVSQDSAVVTKEEHHPKISEAVSNAITVYFPISSQSVEKERSDDFDNSDSKSPQTNTGVSELNVLSNDKRQNFIKSIERKVLHSSTSSFSEDEPSPTIVIFQRNILFSSKIPPKDDGPLPSSDLDQKEPNYYFPSNMVSRYEDQLKVNLNRTTLQHNTVEKAFVTTEIEVPSSELLHSSLSQNSAVVRKEEDCPRINKLVSNASNLYFSCSGRSMDTERLKDCPRINKLVSNASTLYFSCSGRSMDTERLKDFDNYNYESQLTDTEVTKANILSSDQRQNFVESIKRMEPLSSTSRFSKDEHSSDNVSFQEASSLSSYVRRKDDVASTLSASLKQNGPNNYSDMASRYEDQQKVILNRSTQRQNTVEEISVETGNEVTPHKLLESRLSQDSAVVRKDEDSAMIKKSLSNASTDYFSYSIRSVETKRANVFVNGQPISDSAVKNAEMLAGPIEPGKYWYDYQGGFWGVMGHPCLGIIPPFIEEFKYPMPEDCAAGNTGVFVNGRELNQKDLDLLAARGLPTTRDRYYVIEICGTVLDENTGEKLPSLGKLAPTVRKVNQGFGMRTPRALAK